jgi:hypothetical protein
VVGPGKDGLEGGEAEVKRYLLSDPNTGLYWRGGYHNKGWTTRAKAQPFRSLTGIQASFGWRLEQLGVVGTFPPHPSYPVWPDRSTESFTLAVEEWNNAIQKRTQLAQAYRNRVGWSGHIAELGLRIEEISL